MNSSRAYSFRSLMVIIFFMSLLMVLVNTGFYLGLKQLVLFLTPGADVRLIIPGSNVEIIIQSLSDIVKNLNIILENFVIWVIPVTSVFFLVSALSLWVLMRLSVYSLFSANRYSISPPSLKSSKAVSDNGEKEAKKDHGDHRIEQERQRRLFLHFLSVLQREGRILDFFKEDLSLYDDEQIGAAVRSIQEDCKKTVEKYIAPCPVLSKEEGDMVDIMPGFDPNAIKLTGNVYGAPPFKGILRHRGWKAGKKEIPRLSDVLDSSIITPAEVEIE
ncbi:MAG: DUF2760 domain-containing protein [Desulfamplus sp.]|nr:DUF2760 domain-containing protein [Desulfamplus sp.]MBF0259278.1 DUF2760 domain-containing protein [Desulfamplus sp.]